LVVENQASEGHRPTGAAEGRGEKGCGGVESGLPGRLAPRGFVEIQSGLTLPPGQRLIGAFDQTNCAARKPLCRLGCKQPNSFAVSQALRIQAFEALKGLEGEFCPSSAEIGDAEMIDGFLEPGVEFGSPLESCDGSSALTELEAAAAEKIERLWQFLARDTCFEVANGLAEVAPPELDAAEGEIGEERLGHHLTGAFEGFEGLVPMAEIRRGVAEIDQGVEVGASEVENPPKGGLGDFRFTV
jgi:hypothetical protein